MLSSAPGGTHEDLHWERHGALYVNLAVSLALQVYTVPVFDMCENWMLHHRKSIGFPLRFTYRTIYVIFTTFIAIVLVS